MSSERRVRGTPGTRGGKQGTRSGRGHPARKPRTVELSSRSRSASKSSEESDDPEDGLTGSSSDEGPDNELGTSIDSQGYQVEDEDDPVFQALLLNQDYDIEMRQGELSLVLHIENLEPLEHVRTDPESGEEVRWLFGMLTKKGSQGNNIKVAKLLQSIHRAGGHTHTYDAKSGTSEYRVTRIGVTDERLLSYAQAINFSRGLLPGPTRDACFAAGLRIENPPNAGYYDPFEALSAPYQKSHADLFEPLSAGERVKLCSLFILGDPHFKGESKGCGLDIKRLEYEENAFCLGVFPLHDFTEMEELKDLWMPWSAPWKLPIHEIRAYFSEEVGFYFAFLRHLTSCMFPLCIFSIAAQLFTLVELFSGSRAMYSAGVVSIVFICSFAVILDSWKWKQGRLAHLWHCVEIEEFQEPPRRPGFRSIVVRNPVTGQLEFDFPDHYRLPRARISVAASAFMIVVLLGTVATIFTYKALLARTTTNPAILLLPPLLNAAQISVYGVLYQRVAEVLTEFENHKTVLDHNSALFKKLTFFYMISNYASSFYIAFIKGSIEGCYDAITQSDFCGLELSINVAITFLVNDFFSRMSYSVILPRLQRLWNERDLRTDKSLDVETVGYVEKQYRTLSTYDPTSSLIYDYIELYVQWGYLCLFGAAFPLTLFLAFGTNYIETRTDGYKLLTDYRRVLPNRVSGIGEPLSAFFLILVVAVPINAGLCVYTFEMGRFVPQAYRVWAFTVLTVVLAGALYLFGIVYPDVPVKTAIQIKRQRAIYKRVILGEGDDEDEDDLEITMDDTMIGMTVAKVRTKLNRMSSTRNNSFNLGTSTPKRRRSLDVTEPITTSVRVKGALNASGPKYLGSDC